ncbi:MAG: ABC transporter ATP-binding protein, partial [Candidatus Atribacteria bacterium]|nr:ABC transporter ATP-binding protein [Candidatus Atribacteria bacterium]
MMASVTLKNVWKKYGHMTALKGIDLEVKDGELLTILGPSGAGKTSLLQTIAGVENIAAGEIYIDTKRVDELAPPERDVAMVFETYALYPNKTVFQNMAFPLHSPFRNLKRDDIEKNVRNIAKLLQIDGLLDRNVAQLSGGQRQRVALGRMLVRNPKIFLMDEPIAHLDAKLRHRLRGELKIIQKKFGITTLYTTHDYREALGMGDRVVVLNQGNVLQVGTPEEIFNLPQNDFVGGLVGDPP